MSSKCIESTKFQDPCGTLAFIAAATVEKVQSEQYIDLCELLQCGICSEYTQMVYGYDFGVTAYIHVHMHYSTHSCSHALQHTFMWYRAQRHDWFVHVSNCIMWSR